MSAIAPLTRPPTEFFGDGQLWEGVRSLSLAAGSQDAEVAQDVEDETFERANTIITGYLKDNVPIFARLCDLRQRGWENPAGDTYFKKQQQTADNADEKVAKIFYNMMKTIGAEMHAATGAFAIEADDGAPRILDMCMAPGGFLATALSKNPGATAVGFSLPKSHGGHRTLVPLSDKVRVRYLDITMLAEDVGLADRIPANHPDKDNFLPRQLGEHEDFHLVLCDGQVLRTHARPAYREHCEARRLTLTQLALGLSHLRPGGTLVALLHRVESWNCVQLLQDFSQIADVQLFKPARSHAKRSSFYVVARNVRSRSPEALAAAARWKKGWEAATFRLGEQEWEEFRRGEPDPHEVLREFGEELIGLGSGVWEIQANALDRAPWTRTGGA
ncbi:FtsJ-like methyltransferase family protein [Colletotrichum plurivorum]|uniref:FtsJ-like methyltransferase family protein n=1 Tax=Colletotrichum plurivorum TaxID=2175906 RepID=A0A8H6KAS2_9PEZI|nr:FtsJ-like methyltransferase family protein [Colletotrichum plurivorum]